MTIFLFKGAQEFWMYVERYYKKILKIILWRGDSWMHKKTPQKSKPTNNTTISSYPSKKHSFSPSPQLLCLSYIRKLHCCFWKRYELGSRRTYSETTPALPVPPCCAPFFALLPLPPLLPLFFLIWYDHFSSILWFQFLEKNICLCPAKGGLCPTWRCWDSSIWEYYCRICPAWHWLFILVSHKRVWWVEYHYLVGKVDHLMSTKYKSQ